MRGETQLRRDVAIRKAVFAGGAALWCLAAAAPGMAQTVPAAEDQTAENDAIVVTGIRETIETSNAVKREENAIVDALSSTEIGDLPALSIGEAIQTITGATSHQEKGGATEISLRGLGSFLSATTFNGREASNGSGDRAVNFNQFPSELVNDIKIYKSQQANLIEGGVSGTIELGTIRPLDYGKRSIQAEAKANYNPYQDKITGEGAWGWRGTISYVDQFNLGSLGEFGVALGFQRNQVNNPEETYAASSTWVACNPTINASGNCTEVTRAQGNAGTPFVLVPNSITYRQITESDKRDAFMGSVQWQPSDRFDINLDLQYSNRDYREDRHDLNLSETRYQLRNLVYDDQHRLISMSGLTSIEANGTVLDRNEEYLGGGGSVSWKADERLTLSTDVSYSQTKRTTLQRSTRLRTDPFDIDNVRTPINNQRVPYTYSASGGYAAVITLDPRFDVNNWSLYSDDARLRRDLEYKEDKIFATRVDAAYDVDGGFLKRVELGGRYSHRRYQNINDLVEITQDTRTVDRDVNLACRRAFPQTGYLEDAPAQSITKWATFDTLCQFRGYLGTEDPGAHADLRAVDNADVTEKVWAGYVMGTYASTLGDLPIRGNFGVRVVQTDLRSVGLRSGLDVISNSDGSIRLVENGDFDTQVLTNSYFRVLPSINANFELTPKLIARVAGYRGMSRPAPSDLAAGRTITLEDGTAFTSIQDAIGEIVADGSPSLKPIMSWNGDLSLEWYPNRDTIVAATFFYKRFGGGFVPVLIDEQFSIDGQDVTVPVTQRTNSDEQSRVLGFDVTLSNRFTWLPKPLDGFGAKLSYSYADVGFKNYDIRLGDVLDPVSGTVTPGLIAPAGLSGSSKHVASGQLYYQNGPVTLSGVYTYRSSYYQDFVGGNAQLRFVRPSNLVNLRASYNLNRNVALRFEALNVFNDPKITDMPVYGSSRQYHYYGAKYFIGARVRL